MDVPIVGSRTNGAGTTKAFNALRPESRLGDATQEAIRITSAPPCRIRSRPAPGTSLNGATITRHSPAPVPPVHRVQHGTTTLEKSGTTLCDYTEALPAGLTVTASYAFSKTCRLVPQPAGALPSCSLTPWDRPKLLTLAPIYNSLSPGKPLLGKSHGLGKAVGGWQAVLNTTFMTGTHDRAERRISLRDPSLPNADWDHMFNTGTIQPSGQIVNQGQPAPAFISACQHLRTSSQYSQHSRLMGERI